MGRGRVAGQARNRVGEQKLLSFSAQVFRGAQAPLSVGHGIWDRGEGESKELRCLEPQAQEGCQGAEPPALEGNSDGREPKRSSKRNGDALVFELEMGVGGPKWEVSGEQRASPSKHGHVKNQVVALPGLLQSREPRHPAPYLQPIRLPKEGQRVRAERLRTCTTELGTGG